MTTRRRVTLSIHEAAELAKERRQIAMRRAVAAIADRFALQSLRELVIALDRAGVTCIYLEGIPHEVAAMITAEVEAPTIGLGAGPDCDGQVLVFHDLVNLTFGHPAKFVRRYGDAAALITQSLLAFKADVVSHQFPSDSESYHLPKETQVALETVLHRKQAMRR